MTVPHARSTDPESSHLSAREVNRARCAELHRRILMEVYSHGPLIEEQISELAEGLKYTNCPHKRVSEMREAGYLERVPDPDRPGKFRSAPSSAGGHQQVLRLSRKGFDWVQANWHTDATPVYLARGAGERTREAERLRAGLGAALAGLDRIEKLVEDEATPLDRAELHRVLVATSDLIREAACD